VGSIVCSWPLLALQGPEKQPEAFCEGGGQKRRELNNLLASGLQKRKVGQSLSQPERMKIVIDLGTGNPHEKRGRRGMLLTKTGKIKTVREGELVNVTQNLSSGVNACRRLGGLGDEKGV